MRETYDVIVIGAGAAGLTAAGGCALYGLRTALIERDRMGGECLNTGCVPSKALLAAAARAQSFRTSAAFGVGALEPRVDFASVRAHVARAIAAVAPHDSRERFEGWGVDVIAASARFLDPHRVAAGNRVLEAARIVIATGSRPALPPIPGLDTIPFLTNETLWDLPVLPAHLAIVGAGPVGMEMGQAFRRLGAAVTILDEGSPLAAEDQEAARLVIEQLRSEGVRLLPRTTLERVEPADSGLRLTLGDGATIGASHLLVAAGRAPAVEHLGLEAAGVAVGRNGITVDRRGRTSARHIFAIGDCRDGPRLTHAAGHEGAVVVQNVALGVPARIDWANLPRALYTDPELAQIGLTAAEAQARHGHVEVETAPFAEDDRAIAEGDTTGFVRLARAQGRTVGVTIVGAHASDLLLPWSQVLGGKASRFALAKTIVAYPTRSERSKEAAFASLRPILFHPALKTWAGLLARARHIPKST